MRPERFVINDRSWRLIEPLLPGTSRSRGVTAWDNRLFLEAVLWKVRVGGPRDGVFDRIFAAVSGDPDFEYLIVDGTTISTHQKASGAKGGLEIRPSGARREG